MKMKRKVKKKTEEQDIAKIQNTQLIAIFIVIAIVFACVFGTWYLLQSQGKFEYAGFAFVREKQGELVYYTTPLNSALPDGRVLHHNLILRNDPRKLSDIEINGDIQIRVDNLTYISVNPNIEGCEDNNIALVNLGVFLKAIGAEAKSSSNNLEFAKENNIAYATCENKISNTVVILEKSDETKIERIGETCYKIKFKDCEVLEATEKFIMGVLAHSTGNLI